MPDARLLAQANAVTEQVVAHVLREGAGLTLVDSPPGAGKTRLTRAVMHAALESETTLLVAVQTNAQAVDLALGMAQLLEEEGSSEVFGVWPSNEAQKEWADAYSLLDQHPNVDLCGSTADANSGPAVMVGVARKWACHRCATQTAQQLTRRFELGVIDEAYQMRAGELLRFGDAVDRLLQVGDPGQLEPFTVVDDARWLGLESSALTPAPHAVGALYPCEADRFTLPASLRLDARAAPVVRDCFYPDLPFQAVALADDRELRLQRARRSRSEPLQVAADKALDQAATSGWSYLQLPAQQAVRDDPEVAQTLALLARRLLERKARVRAHWPLALRKGAPLRAEHIAVATAHRDQREAVRALLDSDARTQGVVVDTANRLQGREFDVVLVWHPLSGRVDASAFHLDTGRLCVQCSRHRQACVVVGRAGIAELLDDHLPSGLRPRGALVDREHDGWVAHRLLLERLEPVTVVARRSR